MSIRFVYFDAAGTLLRPEPSVGEIYAQVCRPHGLQAAPQAVEEAFRRVWLRREETGDRGLVDTDEEASRSWWRGVVDEVLEELGFVGNRLACFEDCYRALARPDAWHVFDDVVPSLRALRARGVPMGVLSNWDARLVPLLEALGLAPYFETLVISALEGLRKPDPRLFALACQRAGVPPAAILHVGDQRRMDLEPARRAGMRALLVDRQVGASTGDLIGSLLEIPGRMRDPRLPGTLC